MRSTEDLEHEHRVIEQVVLALEGMAEQLEAGRGLSRERAERALEVLQSFADKCHHGKEEQHLFKTLEARGVPRDTGLVAELLHEHGEARRHVRTMARALVGACENDPQDGPLFALHARGYVRVIRPHIEKEDTVLFPMADETLTPEDDAKVMEGYEAIERQVIGEGMHEKYARWAHDLAEQPG